MLTVAKDCDRNVASATAGTLTERGFAYVLEVERTATAQPGDAAPVAQPYYGCPPALAYPHEPLTLRELALAAGRQSCRKSAWRHGTRKTKGNPSAAMRSHFLAIQARPANRNIPRGDGGILPEEWLIAEWPPDAAEPVKYWLSTLPTTTPLKTLVRLGKIRWRIEHD